MKCRVCFAPIHPFMTFGKMPIANAFLEPADIRVEYFYELAPAVCEKCGMFQLMEQPDPKRMFHDNYAFYTGTSKGMDKHFSDWAHSLPVKGKSVVEIGCNDGTFLKHLERNGAITIGVEPSANVAKVAKQNGHIINRFFNGIVVEELRAQIVDADYILAANVVCHIPNINDFAGNVARLLADDGKFIFEEPYLNDMLRKTAFDQIYDEHVFMFNASTVQYAFGQHGLKLIDCEPQPTHGGSMRYTLAHKGHPSLRAAATIESEIESSRGGPYAAFYARCENKRDKLHQVFNQIQPWKTVAGYGATSKSTTVLNYCGLGIQHVNYICDTTPGKQGKLSPGAHIPIRPHSDFVKSYPDYAILFAWNHAKEIMAKEKFPGKWITYVPEVGVS